MDLIHDKYPPLAVFQPAFMYKNRQILYPLAYIDNWIKFASRLIIKNKKAITMNKLLLPNSNNKNSRRNWLFLILLSFSTLSFSQVGYYVDKTNGCKPLTVTFTNTSGTGNYYKWHFGNGDTSIVKNPVYTYKKTGTYATWLDAFDTTGHGMVYKGTFYGQYIYLNGSQIQTSADSACPAEMVSAYLWPNGSGTSNWDFGDGYTFTSNNNQNPQHAYVSQGTYTIKCAYFNNMCGVNDTLTQKIVIKNNAKPSASFGTNNWTVCPTDTVSFSPRNNNGTIYAWTFGDGGTSNNSQPSHAYASVGKYAVKLTITSSCGQSSSHTDTVRVQNNIHFPSYLGINVPNKACPGDQIYFNFNNNITPAKQVWKFGNGDSSTAYNPQYT